MLFRHAWRSSRTCWLPAYLSPAVSTPDATPSWRHILKNDMLNGEVIWPLMAPYAWHRSRCIFKSCKRLSRPPRRRFRNEAAGANGLQLCDAARFEKDLAEWTGLEPATPGVTGRYSNRLNYHSASVLRSALRNPSATKLGDLSGTPVLAVKLIRSGDLRDRNFSQPGGKGIEPGL